MPNIAPDHSPSLADLEAMSIDHLHALHTLLTGAVMLRAVYGPKALEIDLVQDEGFTLVIGVPMLQGRA